MEIALFLHGSRSAKVTTPCHGSGRLVRQAGSRGRFGIVDLIVEPNPGDPFGCMLSWEVSEEQIPIIFLDGIISGVKEVMTEPGFAGDHLSETRIRVVGGAYHSTDSKTSCYFTATTIALRQALGEAGLYESEGST